MYTQTRRKPLAFCSSGFGEKIGSYCGSTATGAREREGQLHDEARELESIYSLVSRVFSASGAASNRPSQDTPWLGFEIISPVPVRVYQSSGIWTSEAADLSREQHRRVF